MEIVIEGARLCAAAAEVCVDTSLGVIKGMKGMGGGVADADLSHGSRSSNHCQVPMIARANPTVLVAPLMLCGRQALSKEPPEAADSVPTFEGMKKAYYHSGD